jgi:hypothetical protein
VAGAAQALQDEYGDQGFQIINPLLFAWSSPPTPEEQLEWADRFGLEDIPVLSVPEADQVYPDAESWRYDRNMGVGTISWLGPDMAVISADEHLTDPSLFLD